MEQGNKTAPEIKARSPFFSPAEILHSLIVDMTYVGWRKAAAASGRGGRGWGGGGAGGALQAEMLITRGSK